MPVRKVSNRGGNIIGFYPSIKMGRMVAFESTIERDLLYLLDFDASIADYSEQPLVIDYVMEGKKYTYTPDFEVKFTDGNHSLIECKPEELVNSAKNQPKFNAGRAWCHENSWDYVIVTDTKLRQGFCLRNIKFLVQFARHSIPPTLSYKILHHLESAGNYAPIREIIDASLYNTSETRPLILAAVFQMLFFQSLHVDLTDAPLSENSVVTPYPSRMNNDEYDSLLGR